MTGTPLYLAPEVLTGDGATPASDVYSLGVLLFHLVTHDYPIRAGNVAELMLAHREGRVQRLRDVRADVPDAFAEAIGLALRADPAGRPATAGRMCDALSRAAG